MKVQILFQERGGDTRLYGELKEALLIHVEDSKCKTENFPLSTQHWVITTNWGDKLRPSSFLRNPREICNANYRTAAGMGPKTGH